MMIEIQLLWSVTSCLDGNLQAAANIKNWTFGAVNMPEDSNRRIVCRAIILSEVTLLVVQQSLSR